MATEVAQKVEYPEEKGVVGSESLASSEEPDASFILADKRLMRKVSPPEHIPKVAGPLDTEGTRFLRRIADNPFFPTRPITVSAAAVFAPPRLTSD